MKKVLLNLYEGFRLAIETEPMRSFLLVFISMIVGYAFDPIPNFFKFIFSSNISRVIILILTGCIYQYPLKPNYLLWIIFFSIMIQIILEILREFDHKFQKY